MGEGPEPRSLAGFLADLLALVRAPTTQWGVCLKADSLVLEADFWKGEFWFPQSHLRASSGTRATWATAPCLVPRTALSTPGLIL